LGRTVVSIDEGEKVEESGSQTLSRNHVPAALRYIYRVMEIHLFLLVAEENILYQVGILCLYRNIRCI
jgi:hypothetical protein